MKSVFIDNSVLLCSYYAFVLPILEYCSPVWGSAADYHHQLLERQVHSEARLCPDQGFLSSSHRSHVTGLCMLSYRHHVTGLEMLSHRRHVTGLCMLSHRCHVTGLCKLSYRHHVTGLWMLSHRRHVTGLCMLSHRRHVTGLCMLSIVVTWLDCVCWVIVVTWLDCACWAIVVTWLDWVFCTRFSNSDHCLFVVAALHFSQSSTYKSSCRGSSIIIRNVDV